MDSNLTLTLLKVLFSAVVLIFIYNIIRIISEVRASKPHLKEEEIEDFVKQRLDTSSAAYTRFISHIATCEKCQEKLNKAQSEIV